MQDIFGSVRRSLAFRGPEGDDHGRDSAPQIRWRKGELIGSGAFGRVYLGMNLDSGELLAVKQVLIATNSASKEKTQAHIKELEEEVKLLKDLSHPNIVRYLGTVREEEALNILLEFVPGGSISSLLGKFGAFPEAVIRTYTKQLLLGLDYLHKKEIMHRDIKGANILVDNKGCIKLADFGASKQATVSGARSMKGTPYWMAPEVIRQTGHSVSADIWSVGITVIEMATGKPPWSQQYQEVAALFHIGTTKSHPPIPEHLSVEAKDFLLKCLQEEPEMRPPTNELLKHPFVSGEPMESPVSHTSSIENFKSPLPTYGVNLESSPGSVDMCKVGNLICPGANSKKLSEDRHVWGTNNTDDDMCLIDDKDDFMAGGEVDISSVLMCGDFNKSFNPMCEPADDWRCNYDGSAEPGTRGISLDTDQPVNRTAGSPEISGLGGKDFSFHCGQSLSEEDDEVTECRIRAFLDEKALELQKLQTPLVEEFQNSSNAARSPNFIETMHDDSSPNYLKLPRKSRSPSHGPIGTPSPAVDAASTASPESGSRHVLNVGSTSNQSLQDSPSHQHNNWKELAVDVQPEPSSPSVSFSERQRKWKEELDQELERKREMMRQAGVGGKTSSPKDRALNRQKERSRFASPGK